MALTMILILVAGVWEGSTRQPSRAAAAYFLVPALASTLMGVALGIIMPLDTAAEDHTHRPWDPRRRTRTLCITLAGWGLNIAFGLLMLVATGAAR